MSKAVEWFRTRKQKNRADKEKLSDRKAASSFAGLGISERKQSCDSETDSDSIPSEMENPFRGRLPPNVGSQSRSSEFESSQRHRHDEWRAQMTSTSKSAEYGRPPSGSQVSREWRDGPRAGNERPEANDFTFGDWKHPGTLNSNSRGFVEKPGIGKYPSADWAAQLSRSSTSTERNSSGEYEKRTVERRAITRESEGETIIDRRQSLDWNARSYANEGDQEQPSRLKEADLSKIDFLMQNWPKLKTISSDKRRFEVHLASLLEAATDIVVVGEEPTKERWSLGIVDEGIKALGKAFASRLYPKVKKLTFTQCRMLLESPFATLARAINTSQLPNLEEITFNGNSYINNQGFFELARAFKTGGRFARLTTLILTDNGMQDDGLIALARDAFRSGNLSSLRKLHIGSHDTEKTNYEEFHFDAAREFAKELSSTGHLPEVEDLRFSGCVDSKGVIAVVEALETRTEGAVKSLDLTFSSLEIEGVRVLARAFQAPQFSSLQSLELSVEPEDIPILLEAFQLTNVSALQRIALRHVFLREKDLLALAALLEARRLPGLLEFCAYCPDITGPSALALVRAYERNNYLVARLDIGQWPAGLQVEYEKHRESNRLELDELL